MHYNYYKYNQPFQLESGETLPSLEIVYHTSCPNYNNKKIIWICHTFTANSNPEEWWTELVGKNKLFDVDKYFIICANIIGSCYGSTNPLSINENTGKSWYQDFPVITTRDIVNAHSLLAQKLKITTIDLLIGASIGGHQAIEWAIQDNLLIKKLILIATNAKSLPWSIAINTTQRMAIEADSTFYNNQPNGGVNGLKTARAIALLSYRNNETYNKSQAEEFNNKINNYKADSYQRYQGEKLSKRFNAYSYYYLTKVQDSHNIARDRESIENALKQIRASTLVIAISSDILFTTEEQKHIAKHIPNSLYEEIESIYGHDAFLIESTKLIEIIKRNIQI